MLDHHFLLAMPSLAGTYFADSLIYICEHNDDGAMGLIVNRPGSMTFADLSKQIGIRVSTDTEDLVLEGGPVGSEQGFVLHTDEARYDASRKIANDVVLSSTPDIIRALAQKNGPSRALVCLGYAGWGPGQLESEIEEDAWLTCPANREVLFDTPLENRLRQAGATIGIDIRLLARTTGHA